MIAISYYNFWVVFIHRNYHALPVPHWVDFFSVHDDADI
jgi:hypothetical protein